MSVTTTVTALIRRTVRSRFGHRFVGRYEEAYGTRYVSTEQSDTGHDSAAGWNTPAVLIQRQRMPPPHSLFRPG
jgi:hypothetical protein